MASIPADAVSLTETLQAFLRDSEKVSNSLNDDTRRELSEAARALSVALEAPGDTLHRLIHAPLQLPMACVGVETKLFDVLCETAGAPTSNAELAKATGVDPILMKRLLRYYQSFGMVSQTGDDTYGPSNVTRAIATPSGKAGVRFFLATQVPAFNALPRFLREKGYANPTDVTDCPWFMGQQTKEIPFKWVHNHPPQGELMLSWMEGMRMGLPIFLDAFDFEKECAEGATSSTPLFVDIGGAMGYQAIAVKQRYPGMAGRVILQDADNTIQQMKKNPLPGFDGIEAMSYDFFTPQPVKGARAYYMRNIIHDWPDDRCIQILESIKAGLTEGSKILIDEMVLPERGAPWRAAQLDIAMSCCFAAKERTRAEFVALFDKVGLKIEKICKYTEQLEDSVIVVVPK